MRFLIGLVLVAALGWGGYWFIGSRTAEAALKGWLDGRADPGAAGWRVAYADLGLRGFPNRFDVTVTGPEVEAPARGIGWRAPFLQLMALSYKPNHQIVVWPHQQEFEVGGELLTLASRDMRASLVLRPDSSLALERLVLVIEGPELRARSGWRIAADTARLASRPTAARAGVRDLAVELIAVTPSPELRRMLGAGPELPEVIEDARIALNLEMDRPLDRQALSGDWPRVDAVEVTAASLRWGPLGLDATGRFVLDAAGRPQGTLSVTARDWGALIDLGRAAGWLAPEAEAPLRALAAGAGDAGLPLRIDGTRLWLGPVALGEVAALR